MFPGSNTPDTVGQGMANFNMGLDVETQTLASDPPPAWAPHLATAASPQPTIACAAAGQAGQPSRSLPVSMPREVYPLLVQWLYDTRSDDWHEESWALMCCCRELRDTVTTIRSVQLDIDQPVQPWEVEALAESLANTVALFPSVSLFLWLKTTDNRGQPLPDVQPYPAIDQTMPDLLSRAAHMVGQSTLDQIKTVYIDGVTVSAVVPPWLATLCPKIGKFDISDTRIVSDTGATTTTSQQPVTATLPHLTDLDLSSLKSAPPPQQLHHQLAALPQLTDLRMSYIMSPLPLPPTGSLISVTRLHLSDEPEQKEVFSHFSSQFSNLRRLSVRDLSGEGLVALATHAPPLLEDIDCWTLSLCTDLRWLAWPPKLNLCIHQPSVDTLSLLPVEAMPPISLNSAIKYSIMMLQPSADPTAVGWVHTALQRWASEECFSYITHVIFRADVTLTAVVTTLPLLTALVNINKLRIDTLQLSLPDVAQLCAAIPTTITALDLPVPEQSYVLLLLMAKLPQHVSELHLSPKYGSAARVPHLAGELLAACELAMRPWTLVLRRWKDVLTEAEREEMERGLVQAHSRQLVRVVCLVW